MFWKKKKQEKFRDAIWKRFEDFLSVRGYDPKVTTLPDGLRLLFEEIDRVNNVTKQQLSSAFGRFNKEINDLKSNYGGLNKSMGELDNRLKVMELRFKCPEGWVPVSGTGMFTWTKTTSSEEKKPMGCSGKGKKKKGGKGK